MLLRMRSRLPALVAIVALVMLAAVVARGTSAVPVGEGRPLLGFLGIPRIELPELSGSESGGTSVLGGWSATLALVIVLMPLALLAMAIVAAVVLALVAARRRRRRIALPSVLPDEGGSSDGTELAARLERAAREARAIMERHRGGPPADAVVAAWVRLEAEAAGIGAARLAHQTPTEFAEAVRAAHGAIGTPLEELRGLYQRARFGTSGTVGPAEENAARAALDEIVRGLSRTAASR
jgi:uncharacterized protein DUF4129